MAYWEPSRPYEPGQEINVSYRLRSVAAISGMHPGGKVINTFLTPPRASGSNGPSDPTHRRFIIDFAGGDLGYYLADPEQVQLVPSLSNGRITHSFIMPNEHTGGFRVAMDVKLEPGQSTDLRAFLRGREPDADGNVDISVVRGMMPRVRCRGACQAEPEPPEAGLTGAWPLRRRRTCPCGDMLAVLLPAGRRGRRLPQSAAPLTEVTFGTNWIAQAEHGGYYQARRGWHVSRNTG